MRPFLWLAAAIAIGPPARVATDPLVVNDMAVEIAIGPGTPSVSPEALERWIENAARDVTEYLGRAPVPQVRLRIRGDSEGGIGSGRMFGGDGDASIRITVGRRTTEADLARDWVLTHEMFHLVLPDLPDEQAWMEEGLASPPAGASRCHTQRRPAQDRGVALARTLRHEPAHAAPASETRVEPNPTGPGSMCPRRSGLTAGC